MSELPLYTLDLDPEAGVGGQCNFRGREAVRGREAQRKGCAVIQGQAARQRGKNAGRQGTNVSEHLTGVSRSEETASPLGPP